MLGAQIWPAVRSEPSPIQATADWPLAPGRDGREDLGQAHVALAGRRRRRRSARYARPETSQYQGCDAFVPKASEEHWGSSGVHKNRWVGLLSCRGARAWHLSPASARTYDRQQPRGEFSPAHSATRAKADEVQITGFSPEISRHPRRRLQHL